MLLESKLITGQDIRLSNLQDVVIRNCTFRGSALRLINCLRVLVVNNLFINSITDHALQFNAVTNGTISFNEFRNVIGNSSLSDIISVFKSNSILVSNNYLFGGGPHPKGGGIMMGDNGGNYQIAQDNIVVDPGQYGIAVAGGLHNSLKRNTVMSLKHPWNNVGMFVQAWRSVKVDDISLVSNHVSWIKKDGSKNSYWQDKKATHVVLLNNSFNEPYRIPSRPPGVGVFA